MRQEANEIERLIIERADLKYLRNEYERYEHRYFRNIREKILQISQRDIANSSSSTCGTPRVLLQNMGTTLHLF